MRPLGLLTGAALLLAACSGKGSEPLLISEINVDTDLSAVGTSDAVDYWKGLNSDLETAIAGQFVGRTDPLGKRISVDVDEISLNSAFAPGANARRRGFRAAWCWRVPTAPRWPPMTSPRPRRTS